MGAWRGHAHIVKRLREAGADFSALNADGKKAAEIATETETKAEFLKWRKSFENSDRKSGGDYGTKDYENSDDEDEEP